MRKPRRDVRATLQAEDRVVLEATEAIVDAMRRGKVSRAELARRLGRDRSYVTLALDGKQNLTLRSLGRFARALGKRVRIRFVNDR